MIDASNHKEALPRSRSAAKAVGSMHYFTGKPCKHGHMTARTTSSGGCMECVRQRKAVERTERPDAVRLRRRRNRENNIDAERKKDRERSRERRASNPEKLKEYLSNWRVRNIEKERARGREKYRRKMASDPEAIRKSGRLQDEKRRSTPKGRLENAISAGVHRGLKKGAKAGRSTFVLLGYTVDDLRDHLDKLLADGMTWENYGEWHVDHKIPRSAFNYTSPDDFDFKRCWSLKNLQPLWAADNIRKHAKTPAGFQPSLAFAA